MYFKYIFDIFYVHLFFFVYFDLGILNLLEHEIIEIPIKEK